MRAELGIDVAIRSPRHSHRAPAFSSFQSWRQNAAMLGRRRIIDDKVAFFRADSDIYFAIRSGRHASRIHFGRMHPAQILHRAITRIKPDELGVRISAGVEFAVLASVELPEVILAG